MVVGKDIDKVYMVMDFGGLDLKVIYIPVYCDLRCSVVELDNSKVIVVQCGNNMLTVYK